MAKFDVTIRETNKSNSGAFIYAGVEAESKKDAMIEIMDLHRCVFGLYGERLDASARCVRTEAA